MHKGSVEEVPQAQIGVSSFKRGDDMWERRTTLLLLEAVRGGGYVST
jgi:hypothetical protein